MAILTVDSFEEAQSLDLSGAPATPKGWPPNFGVSALAISGTGILGTRAISLSDFWHTPDATAELAIGSGSCALTSAGNTQVRACLSYQSMGAVGTLTSVRLTGSDGFVANVTLGIRTGVSLILRLGSHNVESNVMHRLPSTNPASSQPTQVSGVRTYLSSGFSPQAVSGIIGLSIELISGTLTLIEIDKT